MTEADEIMAAALEEAQGHLPFDSSDPKAVKESIKKAKTGAIVQNETIKGFMSSAEGRKYFRELLEFCAIFRNPFNRDPGQMAFDCGVANVGLKVLADLQAASPELYLQMMKEAQNG